MYPAPFDYVRATSLDDALRLLDQDGDAKPIAGGHSLLPMMKLRLAQPKKLVDIGHLPLRGVEVAGDTVRIGALTTHAELASSAELRQHGPLVAEAASVIGDPQVRNRGTLGGNIAHADPGSDLPAALVALGATIRIRGRSGERGVPAKSFFVDLLTTDLSPGELITSVELPKAPSGAGAAYLKFEHPASGYAVVGAAAWVRLQGGKCAAAGLAFNGVTATPLMPERVLERLSGSDLSDEVLAAAAGEIQATDPLGDVYASGDYRVHLARVFARRALAKARSRARGGAASAT
jgi:carbon-monoxide dehydrogenase medium subunit